MLTPSYGEKLIRRASARLYLRAFQMYSCKAKQSMQISKTNPEAICSGTWRLPPSKIPGAGTASRQGVATTFNRQVC